MAGVLNELDNNKQEWIRPELTAILVTLEKKLERKILKDVTADLTARAKEAELHALVEPQPGDSEERRAAKAGFVQLMHDCLGLIKCLQYEGDVNFDTNGFHGRILQKISETFENKTEVMHNYSNTLIRLIQSAWGNGNQ